VGHPQGDEDEPAPRPIRGFDAEGQAVEDEVAIGIAQRPAMPGLDVAIEQAGDAGYRRRTDGVLKELGERGADTAGTDAGEEDRLNEAIDGCRPPLIAWRTADAKPWRRQRGISRSGIVPQVVVMQRR